MLTEPVARSSAGAYPARPLGLEPVDQLVKLDRFVLQRPPQPLDEDVVQAPPAAVHRALRARRQHPLGERRARKLRPLIGVEDLRRARPKRCFQRLDAEAGVHRVRQPPGQHVAAGPVHDRDQVQEARRHLGEVDRGDVAGLQQTERQRQIRSECGQELPRVAAGAAAGRRRQTRTMLEAKALESMPRIRLLFSVCIGHVPLLAKPDRITASRNVSQPVLTVPVSSFVSDCLKA